jgi:UDP-GlcNAc:undecaprenyl-phosphate GlcNAc-1-phosphate transferase
LSVEFRVLLAFLVPLAISFLITSLMIRWAPVLGLVDIPNARKVHSRPIPKGGGLGIYAAWVLTAVWMGLDSGDLWVWGGIGLVIVVMGLVDDFRPLPWQLRLGIQFLAAEGALFIIVSSENDALYVLPHYIFWPAAVIWIVGLTNAFNMLDNMDALSGGVAWIAAGLFAVSVGFFIFFSQSVTIIHFLPIDTSNPSFISQLILMGALTGFLCFNRPPARIFMGDAGSMFLGFFFGTSSLRFTRMADMSELPLVLSILAIPWYDMVLVVFIRLRQGRSPFHADKQHLSHRLVALGLSPPCAVGTICLLSLVIGAGGLILSQVHQFGNLLRWIFVAGCWIALAVFEFLVRHKRQIAVDKP